MPLSEMSPPPKLHNPNPQPPGPLKPFHCFFHSFLIEKSKVVDSLFCQTSQNRGATCDLRGEVCLTSGF